MKSRMRQMGVKTVVSNRPDRFSKFASLLNRDNLVKVPILQAANSQDNSHAISFCLLNSRSVRNKSSILKDFVVDKYIDLLALTETWLRPGNVDCVEIGDLCPTGYDFIHIPRELRGGGVGLLFKESLDVKCKNSEWNTSFQSFEFLDARFKSSKMIRMIIIYRPPSSVPLSTFYREFSLLLEEMATASGELLVVGDFNLHVDSSCDVNAEHFGDLLASLDLKQWVTGPTHTSGHTLDLIITRHQCNLIEDVMVHDPLISDHYAIFMHLLLHKPQFPKKTIRHRKLRSIDYAEFNDTIMSSSLFDESRHELDSLVDSYHRILQSTLEVCAPEKTRQVVQRPCAPWYSTEIDVQKNIRRKLERNWRRTRLPADRERYVYQNSVVNDMIASAKHTFYSSVIQENSGNSGLLFKTIEKLLHFNPVQRYPSGPNNCSLSESFAEYFSDKIVKIRKDLDNVDGSLNDGQVTSCSAESEGCLAEQLLSEFKLVNEEVVSGFVNHLCSKSCTLDPIPSSVFKRCRHYLLPVITRIVNLSLTSGQVPDRFKVAMLKPLLKKSGADHELFSNFRPVSSLYFLSKVTEKAVAAQLLGHLNDNDGLLAEFQSAYKSHHSTETALVKVQNDILKAIDNNRSVILLLLDLSAAFDTVDHSILLSRLQNRFGIRNTALKWFHSYLDSREQFVSVNGIESSKKHLPYGVPQGSVLGPLLYSLYTSPLGDIARKHSIPFHFYADDTQLYLSFTSNCPDHLSSTKMAVELCVKDIGDWMLRNKLKLNQDKTERLVITSKYRPRPPLDYIRVGEEVVQSSKQARNLGVGFDQCLDFKEHVKITCKSAFFRIRSIAKIRRYLSQSTTETIVHAYITSRLDYCNALLYGLPK